MHIIRPQPYCSLTPTPYRLYRRPTHDRMHSHALTHDRFAQAKGHIRPSSPDLRVHISHLKCGEHTPAFTHPQAHYIHPNKHTDPLITYHPNTPHWTPHLHRAEEGPSWGSQPAGWALGPHRMQEGAGVLEASSLPSPSTSTPPPPSPCYCCCIAGAAWAPCEWPGQTRGLTPGPWA